MNHDDLDWPEFSAIEDPRVALLERENRRLQQTLALTITELEHCATLVNDHGRPRLLLTTLKEELRLSGRHGLGSILRDVVANPESNAMTTDEAKRLVTEAHAEFKVAMEKLPKPWLSGGGE